MLTYWHKASVTWGLGSRPRQVSLTGPYTYEKIFLLHIPPCSLVEKTLRVNTNSSHEKVSQETCRSESHLNCRCRHSRIKLTHTTWEKLSSDPNWGVVMISCVCLHVNAFRHTFWMLSTVNRSVMNIFARIVFIYLLITIQLQIIF